MSGENIFRMTGGEAIAEMLRIYEAQVIFGIGGFQLLPFYDAISRAGNRTPRHILRLNRKMEEESWPLSENCLDTLKERPGRPICISTIPAPAF